MLVIEPRFGVRLERSQLIGPQPLDFAQPSLQIAEGLRPKPEPFRARLRLAEWDDQSKCSDQGVIAKPTGPVPTGTVVITVFVATSITETMLLALLVT